MRVLLAIDGSAASDAARDLVTSLAWPEGTTVRVVGVVDILGPEVTGNAPYSMAALDEETAESSLKATLGEMVDALEVAGFPAERRLLRGRPSSLIVQEAAEFEAELIVMGSRGMGPIRSMLLGSVSAEVVDRAPCPVLVARSDTVERILLATDGSLTADLAVEHLARTGYLSNLPVEVLSVAPAVPSATPVSAPEVTDRVFDLQAREVDEVRRRAEATAASAAGRLSQDGRAVRWSISVGNAAHEILGAASSLRCDLVVMGSRGHTGIQRILLGSLARNVLLHTRASVLIVREPARRRVGERAKSVARVGAIQPVS